MVDVVALGELIIDFTPGGISEDGNLLFERNPGGAPANVLTAIARLGGKGSFIGKVGDDEFGHFLKGILEENKIDTEGLVFTQEANTTLAFVHLHENGERNFSFYRKPGADIMLRENEVDLNLVDNARIFHFGSLSMTHQPSRGATLKAVQYAKRKGKIISYDPNWRPPLWENDIAAKKGMELGLSYADILKLSKDELEFLTGEADLERGSRILADTGITLVLVTLGAQGCFYRYPKGIGLVEGFNVTVVDTTGAGDAFLGAFLYNISKMDGALEDMDKETLEEFIRFSNGVGALCVMKRGAIPAMPSKLEIDKFLYPFSQ